MKQIRLVTVGRSDYGMYVPVLEALQREPGLEAAFIVSGAHLAPEFGLTVRSIEADGCPIDAQVEIPLSSDSPEGIAAATGVGVAAFARAYAARRPDLVIALGDRFEMYAAVVAALPFAIPVAHIHGGEVTQGAIDDALRHSMTKLSHLHFVASESAARRVRQLGEESWRVIVSGSPSIDHLRRTPRLSQQELEARIGLALEPAPLLVTFHPVTLEYEQAGAQAEEVVAALRSCDRPIVVTAPNEDTHGRRVRRVLEAFVAGRPTARFVEALGSQAYYSLMEVAAAMVGNSSSGLIEAPSFKLPVVNVGTRQQGRLKAQNVVDVDCRREDIARGIRQALDPAFRQRLQALVNPYGEGRAAEVIAETLRAIPLDDRLLRKRFADMPVQESAVGSEVVHAA